MSENTMRKRTSKAWEIVMSRFTDDLWIEIFLRLPFKSLLRFKLVSKSWFSIISSHRFTKSHLATATKDDQVFIVHNDLGDFEEEDGSFALFHLDSGRILENLKFPYSQGEYPFNPTSSELIGSDCGIVCVSVDVSCWPVVKKDFDLYLWNPATKQSKLLPPHTKSSSNRSRVALGFGFDHIDFDFKVVRVSHTLSAQVYSSNRNKWRKIQPKPVDIPQSVTSNNFDICFGGFLLAVGDNNCMMAFNLNKEVFICDINLPLSSLYDAKSDILSRITNFKDTIAVIFANMDNGKIQLWTLDDEVCLCGGRVKASWTKVLSIDVGVRLYFVEGLFNNVQLSLVDHNCDRLVYDLNKKVTTNFRVPPYLESCEIYKYTKSLFSLAGFKRIKCAASSSRLRDSTDSDVKMDE